MRISAAVINYNYGRYVGDAIESLLAQTRPADQIVVVDDGSTDDSREVLARYAGRVTVVLQENQGQAAATNAALAACDGDVVALLDSDDLALPTRLAALAETYAAHPEAQWVFHGMAHVDRATLAPLAAPSVRVRRPHPGPHDHRAAVARGRIPVAMPATSALSWRRSFLEPLLPMPTRLRSQDNYLKFLSIGLAPGWVLDDVLSWQGIHDHNMYTAAPRGQRRLFRLLNAVDMSPGLAGHGLTTMRRRTLGVAFGSSIAGARFTDADRRRLYREVRDAGWPIAPWVGAGLAAQVRSSMAAVLPGL